MVSSSNLNGTCWPAKPWNREMAGRTENLETPPKSWLTVGGQGKASQYKPQRQGQCMFLKTGVPTHTVCSEIACGLSQKWHRLKSHVLCVSQETSFKMKPRRETYRKKTLLLQGVKGLMGRAQPRLGLEKRDSLQDPVLRWEELLSRLLGQTG